MQVLSMAEAREWLTELPEQLVMEDNPCAVTVTDRGRPVLAILPWDLYETITEALGILSDDTQVHRSSQ